MSRGSKSKDKPKSGQVGTSASGDSKKKKSTRNKNSPDNRSKNEPSVEESEETLRHREGGKAVPASGEALPCTTSGKDRARKRKGGGSTHSAKEGRSSRLPVHCLVIPALLLGAVAVVVYLSEQLLLGPEVARPLPLPSAVATEWRNESEYGSRMWGTYRSNIYFGVRPRLPRSLLAGIMWYTYDGTGTISLRHTCEHADHLQRYGWIRHDGTSFGEQEIVDKSLLLETYFLTLANRSLGETWMARIRGKPLSQRAPLTSLIVYLYNEGPGEMAYQLKGQRSIEEVYGHTPEFQQFHFFLPRKTLSHDAHHSYLAAHLPTIAGLSNYMKSVMREDRSITTRPPFTSLPGEIQPEDQSKLKPNLVAYQITTTLPFELDVVMETGQYSSTLSISGDRLTAELERRRSQFDQRFESVFKLQEKGFSDLEVLFARSTFSNLIGGMAYFYGQSKVISRDLLKPVDYWPASLYTAVPSRSFFPRGFLWDEGFHQLLTAHWDISITKDVLAHWMDLLNTNGWIPREQVLGDEARSKVPPEFIVQHNENANPPTFFLTMETLLERMEEEGRVDLVFLSRIFPRMETWFNWFNTTQLGERPHTFRWRGRNSTTDRELNPKTLTSGLDDYPRSSHPSHTEFHVDLYCWMVLASGVLGKMADALGRDSTRYWRMHSALSDVHTLNSRHWDSAGKSYSDYGDHTTAVKLVKVTPPSPNIPSFKRRKVREEPQPRFVNSFGYVSLFPLLLKVIPPSSLKLGILLGKLRNKSLLWTDYGLRSLAKNDPFYNKYNTEHDPPYWRGSIWININYLAVRALHHYGNADGPYQMLAMKLYHQLRKNLIDNMHREYVRSGYVWEQYDDRTGRGKGTHPFTGWSSLIVLIMAEKY